MKLYIFLLTTFICFWSCSSQKSSSEPGANYTSAGQTSNVVANDNPINKTGRAIKDQTSNCRKLGTFRVDAFIDNELVSRSTYLKGLCIRYITFNTETKRQESEIEYFYKQGGELYQTKVIQGDDSREAQLEAEKSNQDLCFQYNILQSKGIEIPLPDIAADEVRDISNILSVADNYSDFKTETQNHGNRNIIKFVGFNKNIRFDPSTITLVVGNNPIHIKDYEIILEHRYPSKEVLTIEGGELIKMFTYKDGRLVRLIYRFTDDESHTSILEKRFEYRELK